MKKQSHKITNETDKQAAIERIKQVDSYPFMVEWGNVKSKRTIKQNKLQRLWCKEISEQCDGAFDNAEEVRGYCKLHFGVRILLSENERFNEQYNKTIKSLMYEQKLLLMQEPIDFRVTRIMTAKQKLLYLDLMYQHFSGEGLRLTDPNIRGIEEMMR